MPRLIFSSAAAEAEKNNLSPNGKKLYEVNEKNLQDSDITAAILDGSHSGDVGVASEIGSYWRYGAIFALRTDKRMGGTSKKRFNGQPIYYVEQSSGKMVYSYQPWLKEIKRRAKLIHDKKLREFS